MGCRHARMLRRLVVLCFLAGCGAPAPAPVTGNFPLEVGPAGGVIEGAAGTELEGLKLEIPAGALSNAVTIDAAFTDEEPELGPGSNFVGPSFQSVAPPKRARSRRVLPARAGVREAGEGDRAGRADDVGFVRADHGDVPDVDSRGR